MPTAWRKRRAGHDGGRVVFEGTPADLVTDRSTPPASTSQHTSAPDRGPCEHLGRQRSLVANLSCCALFRLLAVRWLLHHHDDGVLSCEVGRLREWRPNIA